MKNYDSDGTSYKSKSDSLILTNERPAGPEGQNIVGLIPILVGAVINIFTTIKEKRREASTAVYSNSFIFDGALPEEFSLQRVMLDIEPNQDDYRVLQPVAADFRLLVEKKQKQLSINLTSCTLARSKAYFDRGDTLAITINIKLTTVNNDNESEELGEGNIIIPMIYVRDTAFNFLNSKGFITQAAFKPAPNKADGKPICMTVKITEVNVDKVSPNMLESILKSSSADWVAALKNVLGVE